MKIKTYRSQSIPRAVNQIKQELGPGAVILNTKRIKKRRFLGLVPSLAYEITAASEPQPEEVSRRSNQASPDKKGFDQKGDREETPARSPGGLRAASTRSGSGGARVLKQRIEVDSERDQLSARMEVMSTQIKLLQGLVNRSTTYPTGALGTLMKDRLQPEFQHLLDHGVDSDLAVRLLHVAEQDLPSENGAPKSLKQCVNKVIADAIETCPIGQDRSDVIAAIFLGPTGVGKTTTIAKLAATFTLGEHKKVRLITLDTYRIAAAEQLRTYAQIIGVPVQVVSSVTELSEALSTTGDTDRVLIDTTGHSPRRVSEFAELAKYLRERQEIEKHLVLSATTKSEDLREAVVGFECFAPDKFVFTKLDETSRYGGIANELIATGRPLSYLTDGQKVPEDLIAPTPESVADLLVPTSLLESPAHV